MAMLTLARSNPVKDAIDAYSAVKANYRADDAAELAKARDSRDATTQELQQESTRGQIKAQGNKVIDDQLGAIRMKVETGAPLTPAEQGMVDQYAPTQQAAPLQEGSAIQMPATPRNPNAAEVDSLNPYAMLNAPPAATQAQAADRQVLMGTFGKMQQAKAAGETYAPSLEEYKLLAREVVNNPSIKDGDLAGQYKALTNVNAAFQQLSGIRQPTVISDPKTLEAVHIAFPKIGAGSNLEDAQPTKIYVQPSPDGDPMKARLTIGITGVNADGETVDGVVTHNRSSDPNDQVLTMTGGEWITQAQQKLMVLDGLKAAQVAHGNNTVMPIWEQTQSNRATAQAMIEHAATMQDGTSKQELLMEAGLLVQGRIPAGQAAAIANKFYAPIHKGEAATQAQEQALAIKKLDHTNSKEVHASDRASAERVASGNNATSLEIARMREAGDDKRYSRAEKAGKESRVNSLNTQINVSTNQLAKGTKWDAMTETYTPMSPAEKAEVTANLASLRAQLRDAGVTSATGAAPSPASSTGKGAAFADKYK